MPALMELDASHDAFLQQFALKLLENQAIIAKMEVPVRENVHHEEDNSKNTSIGGNTHTEDNSSFNGGFNLNINPNISKGKLMMLDLDDDLYLL